MNDVVGFSSKSFRFVAPLDYVDSIFVVAKVSAFLWKASSKLTPNFAGEVAIRHITSLFLF